MNNVPNLDTMSYNSLIEFHCLHKSGKEYKSLFPEQQALTAHEVLQTAERLLSKYADKKGLAVLYRIRGSINAALQEERVCDGIYQQLPNFAKW